MEPIPFRQWKASEWEGKTVEAPAPKDLDRRLLGLSLHTHSMASNESGQPFALAPNIPIEFPFSGRVNEDPNILRSSTRMVTACLSRDEQQIPDPWDLLQSSYSRDYLPTGSAGETSLKIRQVHVIPEILLSQFEGKECKCFMGLLPEIGRVWMTVDNRLFLWDFATG